MFEEKIKTYTARLESIVENITTEEATKTSLIMPFFALLGYDVFNPLEFIPEYTADVGIKKGEKVDYAIILNNEPVILIEAKCVSEKLEKHDSQLFRYFGTTKAKFAILTNGVTYKFFTDLDEPNKMDGTPFLTINLSELKDSDINELKKFEKSTFDVSNILNTASDLKYCGQIKSFLKDEFATPSDDFTKLVLSSGIYEGRLMQGIIDKFKPIVKKSISQYVNELVNDKIKNALTMQDTIPGPEGEIIEEPIVEDEREGIETTEEEMQAYYVVRSILGSCVPLERITYKDTISYFGILIDNKVTRWVCRIYLKENVRYVIIPGNEGNMKYPVKTIDDLYKLAEPLKARTATLI